MRSSFHTICRLILNACLRREDHTPGNGARYIQTVQYSSIDAFIDARTHHHVWVHGHTYVRTSVDKGGMVCPQAALCIDGGVHAPLLFLPATSGVMHSNAESQQKDAKGRMYVFASSSPNIAAGYLVVPNPLPLTAILLFIASLTKAGRGVSPHFSRICLCASCIVLFHSQPRDGWDRYIAPTSGLPCVPE